MRDIPYQSASEGESGAGFRDATLSHVQLGAQSGRILSGTTLSGQSELFRQLKLSNGGIARSLGKVPVENFQIGVRPAKPYSKLCHHST